MIVESRTENGYVFSFSIEKDSHDVPQKINDLKVKLQRAREQIDRLPGTDYSKVEQERQVEVLQKQLSSKTDLLRKYRNMCNFEVPK